MARNPGRRSRTRRVRTWILVVAAVVVAAAVMGGLTARAVRASRTCASDPVVLHLAVSPDLAPAITAVARNFNRQQQPALGRCAQVRVSAETPAAVAAQIDGQGVAGQTTTASVKSRRKPVDAWIPDSSLWVDVARSFPLGARAIRITGQDVAKSPLMIVTPAAVAAKTGIFEAPVGWNELLPPSDGGPPASAGLHVDLPDPADSAAGLATLVELSRELGSGPAGRTALTRFALRAEATSQFDNPASLASFVATASPPFTSRPVTVTTEQAVIGYDRAHPDRPLAAQYPTSFTSGLGTSVLDYPYVLTTGSAQLRKAAREFGQALRQPYATALIRYDGFRGPDGAGDTTPASFGLSRQVLQRAAPATASEAQTALEVWDKLGLDSRDLVLIDTSAAMAAPVPGSGGSETVEHELTRTAALGLSLFPGSTQLGEWEIASRLHGREPYKQLVSVGPLTDATGLVTRRQELQHADAVLQPVRRSLELNDALLAAYKQMQASYDRHASNAIIVLTAGVDDTAHDMSTSALIARLRRLFNPDRRVEIVALMLGRAGDFRALRQVAAATGGGAYKITSPAQIGRFFFGSSARQLCDPRCAAP